LRYLQHHKDKLFLPSAQAAKLGAKLHMAEATLRNYCQKIGGPHEQKFFKKSYGCDPWLAAHLQRTGGAGLRKMLRAFGLKMPSTAVAVAAGRSTTVARKAGRSTTVARKAGRSTTVARKAGRSTTTVAKKAGRSTIQPAKKRAVVRRLLK
jgi:hypothetical protein